MLLRSVGYRGVPVPGIPFDSGRGVVPNALGRVQDSGTGANVKGVYVAGWLKRGPQGIIGTNLVDAEQTARCVVEDLAYVERPPPARSDIADVLQVRHASTHPTLNSMFLFCMHALHELGIPRMFAYEIFR